MGYTYDLVTRNSTYRLHNEDESFRYRGLCTLYTVHCTLYNVHCTMYMVLGMVDRENMAIITGFLYLVTKN